MMKDLKTGDIVKINKSEGYGDGVLEGSYGMVVDPTNSLNGGECFGAGILVFNKDEDITEGIDSFFNKDNISLCHFSFGRGDVVDVVRSV